MAVRGGETEISGQKQQPNEGKYTSILHNFKDPTRPLNDPSSFKVFLEQCYAEFCHKSLSLLLTGNPTPQDHRGSRRKLFF